jgi:predicted ATPase
LRSKILVQPVLVGRERELEELYRHLDLAREGKGTTVFISAEAGIGKTRLMQEFLKVAKKEKDIISITGWCLPNAEVPYFPFIEAFNGYYSTLRKNGKEELESNPLLQSLESTWQLQHLSPQAIKDQTFLTVARIIRQIATQRPIVLLLEDIQWADSASLALIHYIARVINGLERVLFLATFRSENLTSDPEGYPHHLAETLSMMKREDLLSEIKLPILDKTCILKMVESMLSGSVQQSLTEKLAVRSEGNPLFIVESIRMLLEQRKLVQENNEWQLKVEEIDTPSKIRDIIIQRLAYLNKAQRRLLDAASVIGDEFKAGLLSALVDQDSLEVLETLMAIAQSTSIIYIDEDRFRFDHALSREIVNGVIAKSLRQAYHNRLAEKIEGFTTMLPLSDLAYHYAQANNKEKAVKYALAAGQNELAKWSNIEAIKHFTYVLQTIEQDPKRAKTKEKALEGLGDAYYANSLFQKANKAFMELGDTAKKSAVKLRAFRKAAESAFQLGEWHHMLEIIKKSEPYAAANRLENARILDCRSRALMLQMKPYAKYLEDALQVFEEEYSLWDTAWTLMGVGNLHAVWRGKVYQGLAESLRSIAIFEELGDFSSQMETYFVAGYNFMVCQLNKEALDVYAKIIAIDKDMKMGDYLHASNAYAWSGSLLHSVMDDLEKGLSYSLKALELSKKTDSLVTKAVVYSNLVRVYSLLGDIRHAKEYFEELSKLPQDIFNFATVNGEFARAILQAAKGNWTAFEKNFAKLKASYAPGWSEAAELTYARLLEKQGRFKEARAHYEKFQSILRKAEERFEHANMQASLMARRQVMVGEEFEMRFDLVNVGRKPCTVIKITDAIPSEFNVVSLPSFCSLQNSNLLLNHKVVDAFKVETIKLKVKAKKANDYKILAKVVYMDNLGENKTSKLIPISITAKGASSRRKLTSPQSIKFGEFEFSSEAAEKAFKYLVTAFKEDQMKQRLPEEKRGWRTRIEISRNAHISAYSMYGRYGRGGEATRELRLLDAIESKLFLGERGRAGRVLKMRIRYEKVKKLIDEQAN